MGSESLRDAVLRGDADRAVALLRSGVSLVVDADGQTALHLAAAAGHIDTVEALIQIGCDVAAQDFVSRDEETLRCRNTSLDSAAARSVSEVK
jgi:ankyrin repeat protein